MSTFMRYASKAVLTFTFVLVFGLVGCSSSKKADDGNGGLTSPTDSVSEDMMGDSDSGRAMGLQTVHFPYDSSTLDAEAKAQLKSNAQIMKDKASVRVQVEGHCDQRGGIQYNIALGEKRALSVKKYLEDQGVSGDRLSTISYGKEKLVDTATTEAAYAKNRRANFVVTGK